MGRILRLWSFIANPIFVPALVSLWYFNYADFYDPEQARYELYLITLLTAAIPLLIYLILKVLKLVRSIHLESARERVIPLGIYTALLIILLRSVFNDFSHLALYYFFLAVLAATIVAGVLSIARYKISLHLMAMGGMLGFSITLTIVAGIPMLYYILGIIIASGLTASSRLYMKAHRGHELVFGFLVGLVAQLTMAQYYLEAMV